MRWLWPLLWGGIIVYLSLMPANDLPDNDIFRLLFIDKWVHFIFYFIYALLLLAAWQQGNSFLIKALGVLLFCIAFGYMIEVLQQKYTTTRQFEWLDLLFDSVGAFAYIVIWLRRRSMDFWKKSAQ